MPSLFDGFVDTHTPVNKQKQTSHGLFSAAIMPDLTWLALDSSQQVERTQPDKWISSTVLFS